MKVKELLINENKWTHDNYAVDNNERIVSPQSDKATKWCVIGAIIRCYPDLQLRVKIINKLGRYIRTGILVWNDTSTFKQIKSVIDKLDI